MTTAYLPAVAPETDRPAGLYELLDVLRRMWAAPNEETLEAVIALALEPPHARSRAHSPPLVEAVKRTTVRQGVNGES